MNSYEKPKQSPIPLLHQSSVRPGFIRTGFIAITISLAGGCSNLAGPDYTRPSIPEKSTWKYQEEGKIGAAEAIRPDWWKNFQDPYLDQLVEKAIAGNLDLRILVARIDKARLDIGSAENQLLPTLGASAAEDFSFSGKNKPTQATRLDLTLNWELDIWGKTRKSIAASNAEFKATEADWRAGYLTQISDLASAYFEIRELDEKMLEQRTSLKNNQQVANIYKRQFAEGIISSVELSRQRAEITNLHKEMLDLERQRTLAENRVSTLLGIPAGEFEVPTAPLTKTVKTVDVPAGLPSTLLLRRPDILAAEYRLLKAHNLLGKARLDKLPSFSLTGAGNMTGAALGALLGSWTMVLTPIINIPLFDPSKELAVKEKKIEIRIQEDEYRKVILKAYKEIEDTLVNLASRKAQQQELNRRLAYLYKVKATVDAQMREGMISQLSVLESERSLHSAEQEKLQLHRQILADSVTLYKALGGGWPGEAVKP